MEKIKEFYKKNDKYIISFIIAVIGGIIFEFLGI